MPTQGGAWDQEARMIASQAMNAIVTHEKVCAQRWQSAMDSMSDIKKILAYGGALLIACLLGLIGFLATHTIVH